MPVTAKEGQMIHHFLEKLSKRYPDCRVINDYANQEVRVVEEGLTYRYAHIIKMYQSMNW